MAREQFDKKAPRNTYTLREGYAVQEGDTLVTGPDYITRSLEEAFKIKHMLEEQYEIEQQMQSRKGDRSASRRDRMLREAAIARGLDPDEVMRNRPGADGGGGD